MSVDLPAVYEERLRNLAACQGREVTAVVEEALRQYFEAVAITDLEEEQVAAAQTALAAELRDVPDWKVRGA